MDGFMPHGMCFQWKPDVLALHIISDALVALAYFSIPALLIYFVRRRQDLPFSPVFWMFGLFIVACGLTHILSIVVIYNPIYWIEGTVKAVTAAASIGTAIMLIPLLPRALKLRSPRELDRINEQLAQTLDERNRLLARYEREHYVASTLQTASLTGDFPAVPGLRFNALYRPGVGDLEIGGDWYDAFQLADGRVFVSVGDVSGKGLQASIVMGKVRQAIRVAAQIALDPAAVLDAADRTLRAEYPDHIVTAFVGVIDPVERTFTAANAGHPRPIVVTPAAELRELGEMALPLGLRTRNEPRAESIELYAGSLLVFYTDGLIEATKDLAQGERRLFSALVNRRVSAAADPAAAIADAVLVDGARDDVAVMTVSIDEAFVQSAATEWRFDSSDVAAARETRDAIVGHLVAHGAQPDETIAAEMILSELIGNVVRYAPGDVDVRLEWRGGAPVLHVIDHGPGFEHVSGLPSDVLAESGRGLFLIAALAESFNILRRLDGTGSHARAVLPLAHPRAVVPVSGVPSAA